MAITQLRYRQHPLTKRIFNIEQTRRALRVRWEPAAAAILADHHANGISDQSVYDVAHLTRGDLAEFQTEGSGYTVDATNLTAWRRVGSVEDHGDLARQDGYITVTTRHSPSAILSAIAGPLPAHEVAHHLRDAAMTAEPLIAATLVMLVSTGNADWDTDETVEQAATRIALDVAWRRYSNPNRSLTMPGDIFAAAMEHLGLTDDYRDARVVARWWLDNQPRIGGLLASLNIRMGARLLDAAAAAEHADVGRSTWASYVSRSEAPAPDQNDPSRWMLTTVYAWRLLRPRLPWPGW